MAISSLAQFRAGMRQTLSIIKTDSNTGGGLRWTSTWYSGSLPAIGSAPGNTTTGLVPVAGTASPTIQSFTGKGYLAEVRAYQFDQQATRIMIADRVFHVGALAAATTYNLASQPSFASRVPGGTDFSGLLLAYEERSSTAGTMSVNVTYTDQSGNAGHSTGVYSPGNNGNNSIQIIPLASGDCGISKIESIVTGAGTYALDVFIIRPLFMGRIPLLKRDPVVWGIGETGLPEVFSDSCLQLFKNPEGARQASTTGIELDIVSG